MNCGPENILPELKTVLSNVDFVIEGYVDPREPLRDEGPFGKHRPSEMGSLKCEVGTISAVSYSSGFHSASECGQPADSSLARNKNANEPAVA